MQGTSADTKNETANENGMSTIKPTSWRSGGGEGNQKNYHGFQTNEFFSFKNLK